ncbi:hypothetical protein DDI_4372 [Dickeya dianthicola RNS04.9]|nr:hypothetical protein DDI_4372 [Dickeya dianthicola RNS04.9]
MKLYTAFCGDNPENKIKKPGITNVIPGLVALISDLEINFYLLLIFWLRQNV